MASKEILTETLRSIVGSSHLQYADLAAGDASGLQLRMKYSAQQNALTDDSPQISAAELPDRRYLVASITKPIVGMAVVQLAAEGKLSLSDTVSDHVPGFHRGPLRQITIRHLLTHTSGLPDMLPNNTELRAAHASTREFVEASTEVTPDFAAGTACRYSSMGFAVLAEIIQSMTQSTCAEHLQRSVFFPAEMTSTWLGLPVESADELMPTVLPCELPIWQQQTDSTWNWNSSYWRTLGAPWGGMITTADDLGRLAVSLLNQFHATFRDSEDRDLWHRAAVRSSMSNQTQYICGLPEADRVQRAWGYGWRHNWLDHAACFSDFLPTTAIGHWGATGTMMWIDPHSSRWCAILTTQPYEQSCGVIQRMSNLVASQM